MVRARGWDVLARSAHSASPAFGGVAEPTSPFGRTAFRERRLKPLGNLSIPMLYNLNWSNLPPIININGTNLKCFVPEGGQLRSSSFVG